MRPEEASLERLRREGMLCIQYPPLTSSQADEMLLDLVQRWGTAHLHDARGSVIWDVRSEPQGRARSQGLDEFPLHTDACFEEPPPRYVGLFVVTADQLGGGESYLVPSREVLAQLSSSALQGLTQNFRLRVPAEFDKGKPYLEGPLFAPPDLVRYRAEVTADAVSIWQRQALDELNTVLQAPRAPMHLSQGTLLLLDNWRFFHGRGPVKDARRHLKRIRFFGPDRPSRFGEDL